MKITKKYRKRQKNENLWKSYVNKSLVNNGKEHITKSGNLILAKEVNFLKLCNNNCTFKCTLNFSNSDITYINQLYYSLSRKDKLGYLININYRERIKCIKPKNHNFSFRYYFPKNYSEKIRVCKLFFLNCLCISQKTINNVHATKILFHKLPLMKIVVKKVLVIFHKNVNILFIIILLLILLFSHIIVEKIAK